MMINLINSKYEERFTDNHEYNTIENQSYTFKDRLVILYSLLSKHNANPNCFDGKIFHLLCNFNRAPSFEPAMIMMKFLLRFDGRPEDYLELTTDTKITAENLALIRRTLQADYKNLQKMINSELKLKDDTKLEYRFNMWMRHGLRPKKNLQ